jgi:peptide-methionine (S)-S-oxide reductase
MRSRLLLAAACVLGAAGLVTMSAHLPARAESAPQRLPAPALDLPAADGPQTATLSGGCFWGVQGVFEHVKGVQRAVSGYTGGAKDNAQYETVSTGTTGHAESVQITYDPHQVSYGRILQIFFSVVLDPTEKDYQGPDSGTQYRSEIWAANPDQARVAHAYIAQLDQAHLFPAPIVTRVDPLGGFYPAEGYHQDFLSLHPTYPYIADMDMPKVQALQALFPEAWQPQPTLTTKVASAS